MASKDPKTGLTDKQEAFCIEFLKNGGNASAAYRAVYSNGASDKTINEAASRLLKNSKVAARLGPVREAVQQKAIDMAALNKAWVVERLMNLAERCMQAAPVLDRKGDPVLVELENRTLAPAYTFDSAGANRALETLGSEFGVGVKKSEVGKPGDFANRDKDELRKSIRERGVKLGLVKVQKAA